jgi:hypothetical protein
MFTTRLCHSTRLAERRCCCSLLPPSVWVGTGACLCVCDCVTALCTVQGEEAFKAKDNARVLACYYANREAILRKRRHSCKARLAGWRQNAKRRGLNFALSEERALQYMWQPCMYCCKQPVKGRIRRGQ